MSSAVGEVWQPYLRDRAFFAELDTRVHVWRVGLDAIPEQAGETLSAEERERARRFAQPLDRHRFVAGRATLRTILSDVLDTPAAAIRLGYGPAGKPFLVDAPALHFNVSHSEELAVVGVTRAGEIGIDVEKERPMRDMDAIARMMFTDAERAALVGCPAATRPAIFYRIWTQKEALLKALGLGVAGLKDPEAVSTEHTGTAWLLTMLPHLDGFAAALARPHLARRLRLWSWPGVPAQRNGERRVRPRLIAPRAVMCAPLREAGP